MSLKNKLKYLDFFIHKLSVEVQSKPEENGESRNETAVSLGFADPDMITEKEQTVAVFSFKLEVKSVDIVIISEFIIGFEILLDGISQSSEEVKSLVSGNDEFILLVNRTIGKIIDNALEHTNIRFGEPVAFESINYSK